MSEISELKDAGNMVSHMQGEQIDYNMNDMSNNYNSTFKLKNKHFSACICINQEILCFCLIVYQHQWSYPVLFSIGSALVWQILIVAYSCINMQISEYYKRSQFNCLNPLCFFPFTTIKLDLSLNDVNRSFVSCL